jgi:hypothetical protein
MRNTIGVQAAALPLCRFWLLAETVTAASEPGARLHLYPTSRKRHASELEPGPSESWITTRLAQRESANLTG